VRSGVRGGQGQLLLLLLWLVGAVRGGAAIRTSRRRLTVGVRGVGHGAVGGAAAAAAAVVSEGGMGGVTVLTVEAVV
jgi:hypothetical protein